MLKFVFTVYIYQFFSYNLLKHTGNNQQLLVISNGLGDRGSIPGCVIPKTKKKKKKKKKKMVLNTSLLNTQHYKVFFKGKVEQSKERSSPLPYTSTTVSNFAYLLVTFEKWTYPLNTLWSHDLLRNPMFFEYIHLAWLLLNGI